jgi:hypothetical protein
MRRQRGASRNALNAPRDSASVQQTTAFKKLHRTHCSETAR